MTFTLLGADRRPYRSRQPGVLGGHRHTQVFGRLDCPGALQWLARGEYAPRRVFFADTGAALGAGFRPCSRCRPPARAPDEVALRLTPRAPFDAVHLLAYLAARTVDGTDRVLGDVYVHGAVQVRIAPDRIEVRGPGGADDGPRGLALRAMALVDHGLPRATATSVLRRDPLLARLIRARPGLRAPGTLDGADVALRTVVHQQVSLAGARTVLARLPRDPADLAYTNPASLPLPRARARSLVRLAAALAAGEVDLRPGADRAAARAALAELPGIGPWTVEHVVLRALGDHDAFPGSDLALRRATGLDERALRVRAERWRPFRGVAAHHLWASVA